MALNMDIPVFCYVTSVFWYKDNFFSRSNPLSQNSWRIYPENGGRKLLRNLVKFLTDFMGGHITECSNPKNINSTNFAVDIKFSLYQSTKFGH
jgi:hypothetical protein